MSNVIVYGFPASTYVNIVRFVLTHKYVSFEFCDLSSEMGGARHRELHPFERVPILETARIAGGWAGLRPLTPDDHAIIGWAPGVENFFLAVGFGGHGFQHSPTTGRVTSEMILDGRSSIDLTLFDPARFARGAALPHDDGPDAE